MHPKKIAKACEKACLLEASSYPKPGNVSPFHDLPDLTYDDFVKAAPIASKACLNAAKWAKRKNPKIGKHILDAAKKTSRISSSNPNLGILLILVPLSSAASISKTPKGIRGALKKVMAKTTVQDSIDFIGAVNYAEPFLLPNSLDARNEETPSKIKDEKIKFKKLIELSSKNDMVSAELVNGLQKILIAKEQLEKNYKKSGEVNRAVCQTYLYLLSRYQDTLVKNRAGRKAANQIKTRARNAMKKGGVLTKGGQKEVFRLDKFIRKHGGKLNPGSTADITCAAIMLWLL